MAEQFYEESIYNNSDLTFPDPFKALPDLPSGDLLLEPDPTSDDSDPAEDVLNADNYLYVMEVTQDDAEQPQITEPIIEPESKDDEHMIKLSIQDGKLVFCGDCTIDHTDSDGHNISELNLEEALQPATDSQMDQESSEVHQYLSTDEQDNQNVHEHDGLSSDEQQQYLINEEKQRFLNDIDALNHLNGNEQVSSDLAALSYPVYEEDDEDDVFTDEMRLYSEMSKKSLVLLMVKANGKIRELEERLETIEAAHSKVLGSLELFRSVLRP